MLNCKLPYDTCHHLATIHERMVNDIRNDRKYKALGKGKKVSNLGSL